MKNDSPDVTTKISALIDKAYASREDNLDESLESAIDALKLSQTNDQHTLTTKSLNLLSLLHTMNTDYDQSIDYANQAILHFDKAQESIKVIEQKNQELDSFFHRISHDLKGPITSLISLDVISRESIDDENTLRFMDMSIKQVYRINQILDELTKLIRIDHEEKVLQKTDFQKIIDDCLTSMSTLSNFEKITFENKVDPDIEYQGPWALINTIVQNLIENGIIYSRPNEPNPFVKTTIEVKDGNVQIVVVDNGIGMKDSTGKNIFDMFCRVKKDSGSGLGLYILKRAVEKLKGTVVFDSEVEKGSTFTVNLPLG